MYRVTYSFVGSRLLRPLPSPKGLQIYAEGFVAVRTVDNDIFCRNDVLFKVRSDVLQLGFSYLLRRR